MQFMQFSAKNRVKNRINFKLFIIIFYPLPDLPPDRPLRNQPFG
jgi:hypothetical protein